MCRGIPLTAALCLLDVCGRQVNLLLTRFHDDPNSCLLNNKTLTQACFGDTLSACDCPVSQLPGCFELRCHLLPDGTFDLTVLLHRPNGVESAVCSSAGYRGGLGPQRKVESECSENRVAVKVLSSGPDGGRSRCGGTEVITTS